MRLERYSLCFLCPPLLILYKDIFCVNAQGCTDVNTWLLCSGAAPTVVAARADRWCRRCRCCVSAGCRWSSTSLTFLPTAPARPAERWRCWKCLTGLPTSCPGYTNHRAQTAFSPFFKKKIIFEHHNVGLTMRVTIKKLAPNIMFIRKQNYINKFV